MSGQHDGHMSSSDPVSAKQRAGCYAADLVMDGMVVGLGTGSTVAFTMDRLAERIRDGLQIIGIPTSLQTGMKARARGIPLAGLDDVSRIDITIDGADQVDPMFNLIKGRGAAHLRERCIADASDRLVIVIDDSKMCDRLTGPVPLEVVPFAVSHVQRRLVALGGVPVVREGVQKDGPVISDNGNIILDCGGLDLSDPLGMECILNNIPGVVGCGIFAEFGKRMSVIIGGQTDCRVSGRPFT